MRKCQFRVRSNLNWWQQKWTCIHLLFNHVLNAHYMSSIVNTVVPNHHKHWFEYSGDYVWEKWWIYSWVNRREVICWLIEFKLKKIINGLCALTSLHFFHPPWGNVPWVASFSRMRKYVEQSWTQPTAWNRAQQIPAEPKRATVNPLAYKWEEQRRCDSYSLHSIILAKSWLIMRHNQNSNCISDLWFEPLQIN